MVKRKLVDPDDARKSKVSKLSLFGFLSRSDKSDCKDTVEPSSQSVTVRPTVSAIKPSDKRKFQENWKIGRPWLKYDSVAKVMTCDVCIRAQVCNTFTTGCNKMKKENIVNHEKATDNNSHKTAMLKLESRANMEASMTAAVSKSKSAILSAMKNVLFAAQHSLPNTLIPDLNALCIDQGAEQLKDLKVDSHTSYEHHSSIESFQQSLASVAEDNLVARVRQSGVFSVLLDESTDRSVHQNMVVYVRFLEEKLGRLEPKTLFLGIRQLDRATADSIRHELVELLREKGLDISRLVGVATDGASVMVGCRNGVVTQLRGVVPGLLATHCVAHRLALCCGQAADKVRYLVKFQEVLNSMFKYFDNSPKNTGRLESVQAVLEVARGSKLRQVFHTRWLSFEGAVKSVVDNFSGLVSVFMEDGCAKALSMHKPITSVKFLYTLHFLVDVLGQLAILCKAYQRSDLDFSEVNSLLESTVLVLTDLRDSRSGSCLKKFLGAIPSEPGYDKSGLCTFEFEGHTIRDGQQQRLEARRACEVFVSEVVENLQCRFSDEGDAKVLSSLTDMFRPVLVMSGVKDGVVEVVVDYLVRCGVTEELGCRDQVVSFLSYAKVKLGSNQSVFQRVSDVVQLAVDSRDMYPLVAVAAERLLVTPVSTADCERGFSRQNLIKTSLRNRLSAESLHNIMMLALTDKEIDITAAFTHWSRQKQRRILQGTSAI